VIGDGLQLSIFVDRHTQRLHTLLPWAERTRACSSFLGGLVDRNSTRLSTDNSSTALPSADIFLTIRKPVGDWGWAGALLSHVRNSEERQGLITFLNVGAWGEIITRHVNVISVCNARQ